MLNRNEWLDKVLNLWTDGMDEEGKIDEEDRWSAQIMQCYDQSVNITDVELGALYGGQDDEDPEYVVLAKRHPGLVRVFDAMSASNEMP